jgi:BTB/POZ domain
MHASYFLSQRFSDVTIVVGDKSLPAHRMVLASNKYFDTLLGSAFKEAAAPKLELKDISLEHAQQLLAVIYEHHSSHVRIDENAADAVRAQTLNEMLAFFRATKPFALGPSLVCPGCERGYQAYPGMLREFELSMDDEFCETLSLADLELLFELETEAEHPDLGSHAYARYLALAAKEPKQASGFHVAHALEQALKHETGPSATAAFVLKLTRSAIAWLCARHAAGDASGVAKVLKIMREHVAGPRFKERAAGFIPALMAHDLSVCPPLSEFTLWLMRLKMLIMPIVSSCDRKARTCTYVGPPEAAREEVKHAGPAEEKAACEREVCCGERATLNFGLFARCASHAHTELRDPSFFARCTKCTGGLIAMHQLAGGYVCGSCVPSEPEATEAVEQLEEVVQRAADERYDRYQRAQESAHNRPKKLRAKKVVEEKEEPVPYESYESGEEAPAVRKKSPPRKANVKVSKKHDSDEDD